MHSASKPTPDKQSARSLSSLYSSTLLFDTAHAHCVQRSARLHRKRTPLHHTPPAPSPAVFGSRPKGFTPHMAPRMPFTRQVRERLVMAVDPLKTAAPPLASSVQEKNLLLSAVVSRPPARYRQRATVPCCACALTRLAVVRLIGAARVCRGGTLGRLLPARRAPPALRCCLGPVPMGPSTFTTLIILGGGCTPESGVGAEPRRMLRAYAAYARACPAGAGGFFTMGELRPPRLSGESVGV